MSSRLRALLVPRFAVRLLVALLATAGVVMAMTVAAVRQQTAAQVRAVTERMAGQSQRAFDDMETALSAEIAMLGRSFMGSPRTGAALEAALEYGDMQWLAETARYELALAMLPHSVAAFTDSTGDVVVALAGHALLRGDAGDMRSLARRLIDDGSRELLAYRVVAGQLYLVQLRPLEIQERLIGTVAFGLPVDDAVAARLAAQLGAELCFVLAGRCIAGSPEAPRDRTRLARPAAGDAVVSQRGDGRWLVLTEGLATHGSPALTRVMAVPLEPALRPFAEIERMLRITGAAAVVLALLLSIVLSRGLTRHVRTLVIATGRIARGDYTARVSVKSRDEFGALARSFNDMAEGLLLKERYRGVLDKVVSPQVAEDLLRGEITLGGETRDVVTLFADITGFSDMTYGMEPQRVIAMLNECMGELENVVQAHGGVVDKYIGDEIMAIFGAPVAGRDDAGQALRAAVAMQQAMERLNAARARRGEAAMTLRIGVHAGPAVAGNMGSPQRLNYTVIGDAVNLAKRLCSAAEPGQVMATESTWRAAHDPVPGVRVRALGGRTFKGFSDPIPVVALERAGRGVSRLAAALCAAAVMTAASAAALSAQREGLPTLTDAGLRYASGAVQLALSGRMDVEGFLPGAQPAWLISQTDPFVAGRVSVFGDVFIGESVYSLIEVRGDRGHAPANDNLRVRVEQAFLRVSPAGAPTVALQAGKFALPFGSYPALHHTDADVLIRPPLPYDHRTLASARIFPGGLDGFLEWKETAAARRGSGAPIIWDVPYPWGAMMMVSSGPLSVRAAALASAPSSEPEAWTISAERMRRPGFIAGARWTVRPELSVGAAWSRAPYLETPQSGSLPDGAALHDFAQETFALDAGFARGSVAVRGELFLNRWEVPNLNEDPRDIAFYIESSADLFAGLTAAARYGEMRFSRMGAGSSAVRAGERWDRNQRRLQLGAGYRVVRNAGVRAEYMLNRTSGGDPADNLVSAQLWWAF